MKKINPTLVTAGVFILFCVSVFIYQKQFSADSPLRETQSTSKKNKSKAIDGRELELGSVKEQTDQVTNEPSALFNDPAIKQAWGLKKSDAGRAWAVTQGSKNTIVAVIDTGIDVNHEDLKNNLWMNPGESGLDAKGHDKASNGIDDDGNGFIDDVNGWNFVANNNKLDDNHGHGTHIAGIIGAEAGNQKGISGISPQVSLMALKYFDPKVPNTDNLRNTIAAIKYAIKMGAHIINYSGGGTDYSQEEYDAVQLAEKKGILFVAAAGNEKSNSDQHHYYPADYKLKNIISVTAIDPTTEVLSSSNYGVDTVDIAAPGQNILSCLPNNSYGLMTGTSQATAFVSGAAALVMSHKGQYFQAEEIKNYVLSTGDTSSSLVAKTKTARQLNLFKSLTILGGETAISGTSKANVNRQFLSNGRAKDDIASDDPNLQKTGNVSQLMEFVKKIDPESRKKTSVRIGSDQNQGREQ
ncbi:MAG: S8 family serine peptidase [Bdellovibrio sp.]|nr:S8 family serine peptidase [Bdellovibrio sp.]